MEFNKDRLIANYGVRIKVKTVQFYLLLTLQHFFEMPKMKVIFLKKDCVKHQKAQLNISQLDIKIDTTHALGFCAEHGAVAEIIFLINLFYKKLALLK